LRQSRLMRDALVKEEQGGAESSIVQGQEKQANPLSPTKLDLPQEGKSQNP
jgi:hypothetical protein